MSAGSWPRESRGCVGRSPLCCYKCPEFHRRPRRPGAPRRKERNAGARSGTRVVGWGERVIVSSGTKKNSVLNSLTNIQAHADFHSDFLPGLAGPLNSWLCFIWLAKVIHCRMESRGIGCIVILYWGWISKVFVEKFFLVGLLKLSFCFCGELEKDL